MNNLRHLQCILHDRSNRDVPHLLLDPFSHDPLLGPLNNLPCNDLFLMDQTEGRETHQELMTHRAKSRSQHNKNHMDKPTHYQPCLPLALISGHHNANMFSLLPASKAEKNFQNLHIEGSSHAPNLLWQARGSHTVPREPNLILVPVLPAVSWFNLSAPICSTS